MARPPDLKGAPIAINIEFEGEQLQRHLADDVIIDGAHIDGEFMDHPEKFGWWASVVELAKDKVARIKYQLDRIYALADHKVRFDLNKEKAKITEKIVENAVVTSAEYQECMFELLEARKQLGLVQAGKEAMIHRKDMLISLGANMRAVDGATNLTILKEAARKRYEENTEKKTPGKKPPGKAPVGKK